MKSLFQHNENSPKTAYKDHQKFPVVEVSRNFRAPLDEVWKAWTQPELMRQWWGPQGYSCPEAKVDFRVGGKYLAAMQEDATGNIVWSTGVYEEIIPLHKIVCTDEFANENGEHISPDQAGQEGGFAEVLHLTVEFTYDEDAELTHLHLRHEGIPRNAHDECVQGWSSTIDKLQKLVQKN